MRNSHKNGLLKSLTTVILVVLVCALTLTGCSDKTARELANQALTAAQNAQNAADKAQTSAGNAQDKADDAQNSADANKNIIDSLPDSGAVATVVQDILNKYVKGATLSEDSIITMSELESFLASDEVATLLAQYVTVDALAAYAKASDVTALATQLEAARTEITAALGTYVTKEAYEADKTTLTGTIEALTKNMNDAIATLATKAELSAALEGYFTKEEAAKNLKDALTAYCTKEEVATLNKTFENYYTKAEIDEVIGNIDFDELIKDLQDYADKAVLDSQVQYEAATVRVLEEIAKIDKTLADFAKIEDTFDAEEYAKMVAKYEATKLELLRAQRVDTLYAEDGKTVLVKGVDLILAETEAYIKENVNNLAAQLYTAINAVQTLIVPVDHIKDEYKSQEQIDACNKIIEQAEEQLGADSDAYKALMTMKIDDEEVFLPDLVDALQDKYDNLVAAKAAAENFLPTIFAIPAYANIKVDMTAARAELVAAVEAVGYDAWINTYFADDAENVNIERILGAKMGSEKINPTYYDYYNGAVAALAALAALDKEAADLNKEIVDTLAKTNYADGYVLYSDYELLNTLNDKVAEWRKTNGVVTDVTAVLPSFTDLTAAHAYATRMNAAFKASSELVKGLDNALALEVVLKNEAVFEKAADAYNGWVREYAVDEANINAILGNKGVDVLAAYARMAVLHNAAEAVKAINDKIAVFVSGTETKKFNGNINSMATIREIRNEIVTWLNTYNIVPATDATSAIADWIANANVDAGDVVLNVTGTYYADNYDMLNHADLDFVIGEFNKIVADAIAYANAYVIPAIDKIDVKDTHILYQFENIMNALNAYYTWVINYNVIDPDITHLDFGESDSATSAEINLVPKYVALMSVYGEYLEIAGEASEKFLADKETYDALTEAIKDGITVKSGKIINAAFELAFAWKTKYLDPNRNDWNDVIKAIIADEKSDEILTEEIFIFVEKAYKNYNALVEEALKAGEKLIETNATVEVNLYSGADIAAILKAYEDWKTKYGIVEDDFAGEDLAKVLLPVKADCGDVAAAKKAAYDKLVADAVAAFADIKAAVEALNPETFNVYAAEIVDPIRVSYDAWVKEFGLTANTTDAYTDALAAEVAAFKATLEALVAAEKAVDDIEAAKKAETETVKGIIDALVGADKVTTSDSKAVEAARAAYDKWFNGDNNVLKAIDSAKDNVAYGYDLAKSLEKLVAVEAALAAINAKLDEAFDSIDDALAAVDTALKTNPESAEFAAAIVNAEKAIEDAYKAIEEFYAANGGQNNGAITAETMEQLAALANAKIAIAASKILNNADVKAKENYAEIVSSVTGAQTAAAVAIKGTTLEAYEAYFNTENKEAVDVFALVADNTTNGFAHLVD